MSQINSLWQVYLIWALFIGVSNSCVWAPLISTIPKWFARQRGIAVGITVTGFSLGGIIWPPLAQWLISGYGWRQAFLILGLVAFIIIIPLAQFMKHSPQRIGLRPYGESGTLEDKKSLASAVSGLSLAQAIKTSRFWLFGLIEFCFFFSWGVINVHIVPCAIDIGISAIVAASILSIIAGISVISRLSMGFISNRVGGRLLLSICLALATLALIWLLFAKETWMFYLFAIIFGLAYGGYETVEMLIPSELFGVKSLGAILGAIFLLGAIAMALGPILAGVIFDITGSYGLAFLICVILGALSILLGLILLRYKGKKGGSLI